MHSAAQSPPVSKKMLWTGRIMSALPVLYLAWGIVATFLLLPMVVQGMTEFGYPTSTIRPIGVALLISVILYVIPRTSVLGVILLTGYLGGAVATHVRHGDPWLFPVMPILFAFLLWGGLYLREPRLRALLPLRS